MTFISYKKHSRTEIGAAVLFANSCLCVILRADMHGAAVVYPKGENSMISNIVPSGSSSLSGLLHENSSFPTSV